MSETLAPDDTRDALRKIGGLLFGIGALMILLRKGQDWGDFPLFLVLAVPAFLLYGIGVSTATDAGAVRPWQAVYAVFGLILVPFALSRFVDLIGGDSGADLNVFWIFGVTAGLGLYAGRIAGVRFALLVGCLAAIASWTGLWNKLLGDGGIGDHITTYRGVLGLLAIFLLLVGIRLWRDERDDEEGLRKFAEFLTGAGVAAVLACALSASQIIGTIFPAPFIGATPIDDSVFWDVLLLVISVGLIGIGTSIGVRGPAWIGAIGLTLFVFIVGLDLDSDTPDPTNLGVWPLLLLIGGALAFLASLSEGVTLGDQPREWVRRISGK